MDSDEDTVTSWSTDDSDNSTSDTQTDLLLNVIKESDMQDDNNESLSINTSDNEESDHFDKEVKVASNDFRIHGLEMLDNTMLR